MIGYFVSWHLPPQNIPNVLRLARLFLITFFRYLSKKKKKQKKKKKKNKATMMIGFLCKLLFSIFFSPILLFPVTKQSVTHNEF